MRLGIKASSFFINKVFRKMSRLSIKTSLGKPD